METGRRNYLMAWGDRTYTVKDIMDLPEGQRAELFDGELI